MIEIGETEINLDEKEFQTVSKNFDSGYGHDINRNFISMWRYNQVHIFVMTVFGYKEKILMFQLYS